MSILDQDHRAKDMLTRAAFLRRAAAVVLSTAALSPFALPTTTLANTGAGSWPTPYKTGMVKSAIYVDYAQQLLTINPPEFGPANFNGYVRAWAYVQYSRDGITWSRWFDTSATPMTERINSSWGASAFSPKSYYVHGLGFKNSLVRVWQAFEWYDSLGRPIDANGSASGITQWLLVDFYKATFYSVNGTFNQYAEGPNSKILVVY